MEEGGRRDGCGRGLVCGAAFIIVFVYAYVREWGGAPTANKDKSLGVGVQGDGVVVRD